MSIERDEPPVTVDESVSRAYRGIADERVPDHLDRAVLGKAARAARPGYARSRAWTRPLAWAATVALSVAIVLELTRQPALEEPARWEAPASLDEVQSPAPPDASVPAERGATGDGRSMHLIPEAREKPTRAQKTATPVVESVAVEEKREADEPAAAPALQRALAPQSAAASIEAEFAVGDPGECPPEATQQPSSWLECIERLERAGHVDEAAEQRRRLHDAFPGFELP
jgi:hypothetical protein